MFKLYTSIKFNLLIQKAYNIISNNPPLNPLNREIFIVLNKETEQWIKVFIAHKYKLSTNIEFLKLNNFVWKIFKKITPNFSQLEFSKYSMIWKIMNIPNINNFISNIFPENNNQIKLFKIASLISDLFKSYFIHRPDWINKWDTNFEKYKKNYKKNWQEIIWNNIIKNIKNEKKTIWHFSNLLFYSIQNMPNKKFNTIKLPDRIFVFQDIPINPAYMLFLKSISKNCSIHFFCVTLPLHKITKIFINTKIKLKQYQKIKKNTLSIKFYSKKSNLLFKNILNTHNNKIISKSFWNIYEHEQILFLFLIKDKQINLISKTKSPNLLQKLQKKILKLNFNLKKDSKKDINKTPILETDHSISIHSCHTLMREIEILHNNLLNILQNNNNILFQDILVISKNLDIYTPYINNIFNSVESKHYIPFLITHNTIKNTSYFKAILKLINLPNIQLDVIEIIDFINTPYLLNKVNIGEKKIPILLEIINKTKIQWKNDQNLSNYLSSGEISKYWKHGIKRILLGQIMNNKNYNYWNKIVPYDEFDSSYYDIFNKLISFILILEKWKKILSQPKFLSCWYTTFKELINDFFTQKEQEKPELKYISRKWKKIINTGVKEKYKKKIPIALIRDEISNTTSYTSNIHRLFSGKITFCHNFSLINIPFKVIYILGMNDTFSSSKNDSINTYNLIEQNPRIYDPSNQNKYKNLFLKTLLSAKNFFYISYQKYCDNNSKLHYPSFIIEKLIKYISQNFCINKKNENIFKDNSKNIKDHIYNIHTLHSYHPKNFLIGLNYPSFNTTWWKISNFFYISKKKFLYTLPSIKKNSINHDTLILFWKNPIKTFFNLRLNIKFTSTKNKLIDQTNYFIGKFDRQKINLKILDFFMKKKEINKLFQYYQYNGKIPSNNIGKIFWENQIKLIEPLYKKINKIKNILSDSNFHLNINNKYTLYGTLKNINNIEKGLIRWKTDTIQFQDIISLWLEHLIYCSLYKQHNSVLIGIKKKMVTFSKLEKNKAEYYLDKYISGYFKGMKSPILLTKSGINWLNAVYDKKNKKIYVHNKNNLNKHEIILNTWNGNNWLNGEKNDLYIRKIFTNLDQKAIYKICNTAKKWIEPILKNISYSKYN